MQRLDAPGRGGVHIDVEGRLIELNHIDAVGGEPARFLVEQIGERHRELDAVAVMFVGDGVDDRHRAGQGEFELARGMRAREPRLAAHARASAAAMGR